ncbi:hypothetical protein [Acidithiobacillus thiooxidans]|uniref:hypothetical protein n=1 Tax=Acidithiobacillus thiooxidans TaxID=930 RepID=UPI0009D9B54A|nr:hypothetical protein [Acidithiobacillus thiooxidans]
MADVSWLFPKKTEAGILMSPTTEGVVNTKTELPNLADEKETIEMPSEPVSRYELDAKIQAIEARMDTRIAHMESIVERGMEVAKEAKEEAKETRRHVTITAWTVAGVIIVGVMGALALTTAWQTAAYSAMDAHMQVLSDRMAQVIQKVDVVPTPSNHG